jgi:GMP synthase (glutamine-hydrolysing)
MKFELIEPLRFLQDEARAIGHSAGPAEAIVWRQPSRSRLAVRVIGDVTWDRLQTLRGRCHRARGIDRAGMTRAIGQSFAVLTPIRSVGVMGDSARINAVAVRA